MKRKTRRGPAVPIDNPRIPRMADVAQLAGVTAMTVSRALRTPEKVSPETLRRIDEAVRASGFVPNYAARSLISQNSRFIVALVPTVMNSVFSGTIEGLGEVLSQHGYQLLLGDTNFDIKREEALLAEFIGWRPAGVVLTGRHHSTRTNALLKALGVPVVELWNASKKPIDVSVGFSNDDAAFEMTSKLAAWGYRKIGLLYIQARHNDRSIGRRQGYRRAIRELGLPSEPGLEVETSFGFQAGRTGLRQLLDWHPDVNAVMCASDTLAVGALMEALRLGKRVPKELGIAGFGDVELAAELVPALTTVRLPRMEIGRRTGEVLLQRIAGTYGGSRAIDCGFSIVRRESA